LESAEKFLDNGGEIAICAGLYTYAVEEYGKLLLLNKCKPSGGMVEIRFRDWFRNHTDKFNIANENLPDECKTLHKGAFSRAFRSQDFDTETVADFEARLAIFYSDFTDRGDIKRVPSVDKDLLKKAINKLTTIAFGTTIP
jgi:AbiV family abortive infection protein